jgi:integrase
MNAAAEEGPDAPASPDWLWALERMRGAYADNTLTCWTDGFACFETWCAERGETALPAEPRAVADFVDWLFETSTLNTVLNRLYGVRMVSLACGFEDPTRAQSVRLAVRRGKRRLGVRRRQAEPLCASRLERLLEACPDTLLGMRDRCLLRLGYDSLCRSSELIGLRIEDVNILSDGSARVAVRKDKQDYAGDGVAFISRPAVASLEAWLEVSGYEQGPILRGVNGSRILERGLTKGALNKRLKVLALAAGFEPELAARISGHSFRVGAVQDLTVAGASLLQIMRAGRWRDADQVAYYAREVPVNIWGQSEGDGYPLAAASSQRRRRFQRAAARPPGRRLPTSG